jgi:hypothetical protein
MAIGPRKRQLLRDYLLDSLNWDDDRWVGLPAPAKVAALLAELAATRKAALQRQKEAADAESAALDAEG